jgi:5-methylthioadenosine/S-adenosylhomocysteine deaminase
MSETKRHVDILIVHGLLVTMNAQMTVIHDGAVAVQGNTIVAVGPTPEMEASFDAAAIIDASNRLVMPGLVNAHTHSPAVIFRGLTEDMRLEPWLQKSWRFEAKFVNPGNIRTGAQVAQAEMIRSGTTTALDMYWFPEIMAQVAQQSGFRLMTGPLWLDFPNAPDGVPMNERTARGREFLEQFRNDPLVVSVVQPHSTYTVTKELLLEAWALAQEFGVWFNTHCSETAVEVETVEKSTGDSPPRYLDSLGILSSHTVLAHCVHVTPDEIDLLAQRGVTVAHCPVSNLKLAAGIAPVVPMLRAGVRVALGTDSAQSSNDLNLWNDLRLAPILQKTIVGDPTVMPAPQVVKMATCDAARALGLGDKIGSLESGKRADIVLLDLDAVHAQPLYDVYAQLLYALGRDDVTTVLIDGKIVMRDRELCTLNESEMSSQLHELAASILAEQESITANG